MADFWLKTRDTKPSLVASLVDGQGNAVNLNGSIVTFCMRLIDATENTVEAEADVTDGPGGAVIYHWQEGDTDVAGGYISEFVVSFADDTEGTFPNQTYDRIAILERLGDPVAS